MSRRGEKLSDLIVQTRRTIVGRNGRYTFDEVPLDSNFILHFIPGLPAEVVAQNTVIRTRIIDFIFKI